MSLKLSALTPRQIRATRCKRQWASRDAMVSDLVLCIIFSAINESFLHTENSFLQIPPRNSKLEPILPGSSQPVVRPLSSTDETGPAQKRLRSTIRQKSIETMTSKPSKLTVDETSKKARARPALKFANIFSSPGRPSQPVITSRTTAGGGIAKGERGNAVVAPRRSTRLLSGSTNKPSSKVG